MVEAKEAYLKLFQGERNLSAELEKQVVKLSELLSIAGKSK